MADKGLPSPEVMRQLLRYEPDTGKLFWRERSEEIVPDLRARNQWNSRFSGKEAMTADCGAGYRQGRIFNNAIRAHRAAWVVYYGEWPKEQIDHINGDRTDNRIENLREVTHTMNARNQSRQRRSKSGYTGVRAFRDTGRWTAKIKVDGKNIHLGYFANKADAVAARARAEVVHGFHENHGRPARRKG